jgi:hypothetical protein
LSDHSNFKVARSKLAKGNKIIDDYEKLVKTRTKEALREINFMEFPNKQETIEEFLKGVKEKDRFNKEFFRIQRESLSTMGNLLNFLSSKKDKYYFDQEQIVFFVNDDIKKYNNYMQRLSQLVHEEEKWFEKYQQVTTDEVNKLKKYTK